MSIKALVFDLNGTLLDLSSLDPLFARIFGSPDFRERWFSQMLSFSMVTIPTLAYTPFDKISRASLLMLAKKENLTIPAADLKELLDRMTKLPPFPDVPDALERLHNAGYRLCALTNGTPKAAKSQLKFARLSDYFEEILSVDTVEQFKPGPKPYLYAAKQLALKPAKLLMVAAHHWDLEGAHHVGYYTAFLQRPNQFLNPLWKKPDYTAPTIATLADQLE